MFIADQISQLQVDDFMVLPLGPYAHEAYLRHAILFKGTH